MSEQFCFTDAREEGHFAAMSRIHALGWRSTYRDAVPADYMAREITDGRWVPYFRADFETGRCRGLLLYRGDAPVSCLNYGPARCGGYEGWGEILSFYTHPEETGRGYGGLIFEEAMQRLRADGFTHAYVLVLRENEGARRFYAAHGFQWDGTHELVPFPGGADCVDLRYTRTL